MAKALDPTGRGPFRLGCIYCGHFDYPDVDFLGFWTCHNCAEPLDCDECGGVWDAEHGHDSDDDDDDDDS